MGIAAREPLVPDGSCSRHAVGGPAAAEQNVLLRLRVQVMLWHPPAATRLETACLPVSN